MSIQFINKKSGGADINEYFDNTIKKGSTNYSGLNQIIKKIPTDIVLSGNSAAYLFSQCKSLIEVPMIDTSNVIGMGNMFDGCESLVTVPVYDTSKVTAMGTTFRNCNSLSNNSLNNIMEMCKNVSSNFSTAKTLKTIGLSEAQTQICVTLSNWEALQELGWTTGY